MSLSDTMRGDRCHIAIFGRTNAGKSSLINAVTGQDLALVSEIGGTTTDPVEKAMEILPLGPCLLIDTPGLDDESDLGEQRVKKSLQILPQADMALVVMDLSRGSTEHWEKMQEIPDQDLDILVRIMGQGIPFVLVCTQTDRLSGKECAARLERIRGLHPDWPVIGVSAHTGQGIRELREMLAAQMPRQEQDLHLLGDLVEPGDMVVLVTPVDRAAPKGRLIMPQQQTIRDLLDHGAVAVVTQVPALAQTLERLRGQVKLVVTDSQAFGEVDRIVPEEIALTSFSILFARKKGDLSQLSKDVSAVEQLRDGDRVLIAEGCSHHRTCDDIGTVKIPQMLREKTGRQLVIETCSGREFPEDLSPYRLVIHCGGCTLTPRQMRARMRKARLQGVPMVNYGIFIAYVKGILKRSMEVLQHNDDVDSEGHQKEF